MLQLRRSVEKMAVSSRVFESFRLERRVSEFAVTSAAPRDEGVSSFEFPLEKSYLNRYDPWRVGLARWWVGSSP